MINYTTDYIKVKELREKRGISRHDMAYLLDLNERSYTDKEYGHRNFTLAQTVSLAKIFCIKIEELITVK